MEAPSADVTGPGASGEAFSSTDPRAAPLPKRGHCYAKRCALAAARRAGAASVLRPDSTPNDPHVLAQSRGPAAPQHAPQRRPLPPLPRAHAGTRQRPGAGQLPAHLRGPPPRASGADAGDAARRAERRSSLDPPAPRSATPPPRPRTSRVAARTVGAGAAAQASALRLSVRRAQGARVAVRARRRQAGPQVSGGRRWGTRRARSEWRGGAARGPFQASKHSRRIPRTRHGAPTELPARERV